MTKKYPDIFLAISYHENDFSIREFFKKILSVLDYNVIEGDFHTPTPPPEKVRELIEKTDCSIFVFTKRNKIEGKEEWTGPEWLSQELGMAFQAGKYIAVLIENGINPEGIIPSIVSYEKFERDLLINYVPSILKYLIELRRNVTGPVLEISEDKIAIIKGILDELGVHLQILAAEGTIPQSKINITYYYIKLTGRIYLLPVSVVEQINKIYSELDDFYSWVRDTAKEYFKDYSFKWQDGKLIQKEKVIDPQVIALIEEARPKILGDLFDTYFDLMGFINPQFQKEWSSFKERALKGEFKKK